ncbi:Frag1/DRAM/Sfk1 [Coniella lustricola]|uniref:Frag1/DRAM/Sfk1 n=1 Tax=Coniella lustricola TaxID=2025994 RepID=A0A2T3AK40_9PEZI|nr:Frag1/DRAM/Sfk1 [Coniella lustricola]
MAFPFWLIPVFSGCVWLGGLLAMLCTWVVKGEPYYPFMNETSQHIVYISDIGATSWGKPIFIATSAVMVVTFDLVFINERWLRHKRALVPNYSKWEKAMSVLSIVWSIVGAAGLILLTIFDTAHHKTAHDSLLGVFIAGYVISAICVCVEYLLLGLVRRKHEHSMAMQSHRQHRLLLASFIIKACFIVVEVALAIAFGVTEYTGKYNQSAILEWIVALVYIFYVWSYVFDFLPVNFAHHRTGSNRFPAVKRGSEEMAMTNDGSPAYAF